MVPGADGNEQGAMLFVDDLLVGVLVRLDASFYGQSQGCWNLECGFGRCTGTPAPFELFSDALDWVGGRLGVTAQNRSEVLADADQAFRPRGAGGTKGRQPR